MITLEHMLLAMDANIAPDNYMPGVLQNETAESPPLQGWDECLIFF